jgi:Raf kinase inhibitor-like YbhB/YbcL family protein
MMLPSLAAATVISIMAAASASAAGFTLASPTLADGKVLPDIHVYNGYSCSGGNISPELSWTAPPAGTGSFAVTVHDPDAPHEGGWWHWVVFDIPASATGLPANAGSGTGLPAGTIQSKTDFGKPGYGGACPPPGKPHHYVFAVYALKVATIGLKANASPAAVDAAIAQNSLGKATITALYGR